MLIVGIAGGTGSGKTTAALSLVQRLGDDQVTLIAQDSYYIDRSDIPAEQREQINYDHPDSFDYPLLVKHLDELRKGRDIRQPIYDFSKHVRRRETRLVQPRPVIIVEGILILAETKIRSVLDIKVFVDTDPDVRILRRVIRDMLERGRSIESIQKQYLETVKPMHDAFVEPSKRYADIILPEGGRNPIALDLLTSWIQRRLRHED